MVKLPEPPKGIAAGQIPKSAGIVMIVILVAMAFVSIFANIQRWRRDKIETVIVTPALPTATP